MLKHIVYTDRNGMMDNTALVQSDFVNARSLAATVAEADTIPTGARFVQLTASTTCYFRIGAAAAIPSDVADGSSSELIPQGVSTFRAIVPAVTTGSIAASSTSLTVLDTAGMTINDTLLIKGAGAAGVDLTTTITAVNPTTGVVTLAAAASTTVASAAVSEQITTIGVISPTTCVVTLCYWG